MNTKINLTYNSTDYVLEVNRMTVKALEGKGFSLEELSNKPFTMIDLAFAGAFMKNHRAATPQTISEIYESCPNKSDLMQTLIQMYSETYETLMADPSESSAGNASWVVSGAKAKK